MINGDILKPIETNYIEVFCIDVSVKVGMTKECLKTVVISKCKSDPSDKKDSIEEVSA